MPSGGVEQSHVAPHVCASSLTLFVSSAGGEHGDVQPGVCEQHRRVAGVVQPAAAAALAALQ